jgi:hypothetical protein
MPGLAKEGLLLIARLPSCVNQRLRLSQDSQDFVFFILVNPEGEALSIVIGFEGTAPSAREILVDALLEASASSYLETAPSARIDFVRFDLKFTVQAT